MLAPDDAKVQTAFRRSASFANEALVLMDTTSARIAFADRPPGSCAQPGVVLVMPRGVAVALAHSILAANLSTPVEAPDHTRPLDALRRQVDTLIGD